MIHSFVGHYSDERWGREAGCQTRRRKSWAPRKAAVGAVLGVEPFQGPVNFSSCCRLVRLAAQSAASLKFLSVSDLRVAGRGRYSRLGYERPFCGASKGRLFRGLE
jgi:hypothetical protein